ncbi:CcdB family protein (plasmid) [Kozakia baliensis]
MRVCGLSDVSGILLRKRKQTRGCNGISPSLGITACLLCHAAESAFSGLVLDVLADLLQELETPVVVPLLPKETAPKLAKWPNPVFIVDDRSFVIVLKKSRLAPCLVFHCDCGTHRAL